MPPPSRATLILGKEKFLKREFLREFSAKVFAGDSNAGLNTQEFSSAGEGFSQFVEFIQTAPFLASHRLGILWEVESLTEDQQKVLLILATQCPQSSQPVLISEESNAKKDPFIAALAAVCRVTFCHTPFEKDLPFWVQTQARKVDRRIDKDAIAALFDRVGKEIAFLKIALEQLSLYTQPRPVITEKDVTDFFGKSSEEDVFGLVDMLIESRLPDALESLERLFQSGASGYEIIGALAGQLERLRRAAELAANGCPPREVSAKLNVHPFFREKFARQLALCDGARLAQLLASLLECDESVKTGRLHEKLAVERFFLESGRKKP